jgi:hypothetical protein
METKMKMTLLAATAVAGFAMAAAVSGAQAAPLGLSLKAPAAQSLAEKVDYRDRCVHQRRECAERWGWRTWRWRRCVIAHGC